MRFSLGIVPGGTYNKDEDGEFSHRKGESIELSVCSAGLGYVPSITDKPPWVSNRVRPKELI